MKSSRKAEEFAGASAGVHEVSEWLRDISMMPWCTQVTHLLFPSCRVRSSGCLWSPPPPSSGDVLGALLENQTSRLRESKSWTRAKQRQLRRQDGGLLHSAVAALAALAKALPPLLLARKMRDGKSVRISPGRIMWD